MSEQATNTDLTIVRKENVQMIAQTAPEVYKNNTILARSVPTSASGSSSKSRSTA